MIDPDVLEQVAAQLAARVRDDDPDTNGDWLAGQIPDGVDPAEFYRAGWFVAAAAVPTGCPHCHRELTWRQLTAWAWLRQHGDGYPDTPQQIQARRREWLVDDAAVARAVAGDEPGRTLTHDERVAVIRALHRTCALSVVAQRAGCTQRTVQRILNGLRDEAA